jgi:hypothetical protein
MALGFFRRRQKLVLIVMVLLMVAFLIPASIRGFFDPKTHKDVIGWVGGKEVTKGTLWSAAADIRILRRWLGMGFGRRPGEAPFAMFLAINDRSRPELGWALLLHEAREMGIRVTDQQVDSFLAASGLTGQTYQQRLAELAREKFTERHLRRAVANQLIFTRALEAALVTVPPSLPEIRIAHRDLREKLDLGMVVLKAEDFTAAAAEPTGADIQEWFENWKQVMPGRSTDGNPFGFGYWQPNRADVAWLLIDQDRLAEAVKVPDRLMQQYWLRHRGELTKEVPIPTTATAPTTTQSAQPTQPAEPKTRTVVIQKYSEAKPLIRERLRTQVAEQKMEELLKQAKQLIARYGSAREPCREALKALTGDAGRLLGRKIGPPPATPVALETLVEQLEDATGVRIVYPYGQHEKLSIDGKVKVSLGKLKEDLTLRQALEKIRLALKLPQPFTWKSLEGLDDAIFPTGPVSLLPVRAGRTGMLDFRQLGSEEPLAWAGTTPEGGLSLVDVVATAKVFQGPEPRQTPLVEVGRDFPEAMYLAWPVTGRLLWRLMAAEPEHEPKSITPAIRRQVIEDIKVSRAFEKAREAARKMLAQVQAGENLEDLAKAAKREFVKTGLIPRKRVFLPRQPPFIVRMVTTRVPEAGSDPDFLKQAFALAPADPDDYSNPGPGTIVLLRPARKLLLIQRIGYEPPVEQEFDETTFALTLSMLRNQRLQEDLIAWLAFDRIKGRVRFTFKQAGD